MKKVKQGTEVIQERGVAKHIDQTYKQTKDQGRTQALNTKRNHGETETGVELIN